MIVEPTDLLETFVSGHVRTHHIRSLAPKACRWPNPKNVAFHQFVTGLGIDLKCFDDPPLEAKAAAPILVRHSLRSNDQIAVTAIKYRGAAFSCFDDCFANARSSIKIRATPVFPAVDYISRCRVNDLPDLHFGWSIFGSRTEWRDGD